MEQIDLIKQVNNACKQGFYGATTNNAYKALRIVFGQGKSGEELMTSLYREYDFHTLNFDHYLNKIPNLKNFIDRIKTYYDINGVQSFEKGGLKYITYSPPNGYKNFEHKFKNCVKWTKLHDSLIVYIKELMLKEAEPFSDHDVKHFIYFYLNKINNLFLINTDYAIYGQRYYKHDLRFLNLVLYFDNKQRTMIDIIGQNFPITSTYEQMWKFALSFVDYGHYDSNKIMIYDFRKIELDGDDKYGEMIQSTAFHSLFYSRNKQHLFVGINSKNYPVLYIHNDFGNNEFKNTGLKVTQFGTDISNKVIKNVYRITEEISNKYLIDRDIQYFIRFETNSKISFDYYIADEISKVYNEVKDFENSISSEPNEIFFNSLIRNRKFEIENYWNKHAQIIRKRKNDLFLIMKKYERMKEEAVKKNKLNERYLNALLKNFSCEKHPLASIITEGIDAIKSRIHFYITKKLAEVESKLNTQDNDLEPIQYDEYFADAFNNLFASEKLTMINLLKLREDQMKFQSQS